MINIKKALGAVVAVFAVFFVLDILVHGFALMGLYEQTVSVWRPEEQMQKLRYLMNIGQLLFAVVFVWIYGKGYESNKPGVGQGIRYGLYVGLLVVAFQNFVWYVVLPIPFALVLAWMVAPIVKCLAAGVAVGALYNNR